jgi:hypothetical protein
MKYTKEEVKILLVKNTHVLYSDKSDELKQLLMDIFPKDKFFQNGGTFDEIGLYIFFKSQWFFGLNANGRIVIHLRDILEEVIWKSEDMEYLDWKGRWKDCDPSFETRYRLKPKSDKELELERLAEELGYNLTKK